jgi:hypothetical protein
MATRLVRSKKFYKRKNLPVKEIAIASQINLKNLTHFGLGDQYTSSLGSNGRLFGMEEKKD